MLTATLLLALAGTQDAPEALAGPPEERKTIAADVLAEDVRILGNALEALHPGLHRYQTPDEFRARLEALADELAEPRTRREAYLALSRFLATIRCGHTYANFWNQSDAVQAELFERDDQLPFTFRWLDGRMVVTDAVVEANGLVRGAEVVSIDGRPANGIRDALWPYVHADGANDAMRENRLELTGVGEYETFDVFFPLVVGGGEDGYDLVLRAPGASATNEVHVPAVGRAARAAALGAPAPDETWEFRFVRDDVAYLRLGTFVTWKMELDWQRFLRDAFGQVEDREPAAVILDLRGNGGGNTGVNAFVRRGLLAEEVTLPATRSLLRYDVVPEELRPHLGTWEESLWDVRAQVEAAEGGFFRRTSDTDEPQVLRAGRAAFDGPVYVLVGPANSSATFLLADQLGRASNVRLVGRPTGGNQRGINGSYLFFLTLPGSGLEVDVPLVAGMPLEERPDGGLEPDVLVAPSPEDVADGVDRELTRVLELVDADD